MIQNSLNLKCAELISKSLKQLCIKHLPLRAVIQTAFHFIVGYLLDQTGTYQVAMSIVGSVQIAGGLMVCSIVILQWWCKRHPKDDNVEMSGSLRKTRSIHWLGSGEILECSVSSI